MGALGAVGLGVAGATSLMSGGSGASSSKSQQQSTTTPVIIPRYPAVIPSITTGQGSRISVTPTYNTSRPVQGTGIQDTFGGGTFLSGAFSQALSGAIPEAPTSADYAALTARERSPSGAQGRTYRSGTEARRRAAQEKIDAWNQYLAAGAPGEVGEPGVQALTGADIGVSIDPSIAENREQLQTSLTNLQGTVEQTVGDIQGRIEELSNVPLPAIDEAGFDMISEWGAQQRSGLQAISTQLDNQIGQLEQMYERLGENSGSFIEARTRDLVEQRERARRDASRRGISGPLSALATNPFDVSIADERARAQQDIEQARLQVRDQQRQLQETKLQTQQQLEQVRQGELTAVSEKFAQADAQFGAGLDREATVGGLYELLQGSQSMIQSILDDQSGLNQQALQQEMLELGLGAEIYQMLIESQLTLPTAQESQSSGTSSGSTAGNIVGDMASIFGGIGGLMG